MLHSTINTVERKTKKKRTIKKACSGKLTPLKWCLCKKEYTKKFTFILVFVLSLSSLSFINDLNSLQWFLHPFFWFPDLLLFAIFSLSREQKILFFQPEICSECDCKQNVSLEK